MLALDVDGTLLDREGELRATTARAVARAAEAGIRPLLCTGRRYRRAWPVARQLGLEAPIVCNSGSIVKDPKSDATLWRADFDADLLASIARLFRQESQHVLSFLDHGAEGPDFLVESEVTGCPLFDDYVERNREHAAVAPGWMDHGEFLNSAHFHLCSIGERGAMLRFEQVVQRAFGARVRTFVQKSPSYPGTMCEVIRGDASKWSAILQVAELWGVSPSQVVAVGDDMNDLPMIAGAGLGVAMGHAPESVRVAADLVTGDYDNDGVTRLVDDVLLSLGGTS